MAIAVIFVSHYGHRAHRPRWLALGETVFGLGCLVFALPHFLAGRYHAAGTDGVEMCTGTGQAEVCASTSGSWYYLFLLGVLLIALGSSPLYPLGTTFLDDNVNPDRNGTYLGVFYGVGALGPAVGFGLGGIFLNMYVDQNGTTTLKPDSSAWVGRWWAGFLVAGFLALGSSLLLYIYPRQLPGQEWVLEFRKAAKDHQSSARTAETRLGASLLSLIKNKPYIFSQLGTAAETFVIIGLATFAPKYVETQFRLTSSEASLVTGGVVIVGVVAGTVVGGQLMERRRWSPKVSARNVAIIAGLAWTMSFSMLIHCPVLSLAGVTTPYPVFNGTHAHVASHTSDFHGASRLEDFHANCTSACDCNSLTYNPVCGSDGITYFSPCYAGCTTITADNSYSNCSCVALPDGAVATTASLNKCSSGCNYLPLFMVLALCFMFVTFLLSIPSTSIAMRFVPENQRSLALGFGSTIYRIFGSVISPIIFGLAIDDSCLLWESKCNGDKGSCWEYDTKRMSARLFLLCVILKGVSTFCFSMSFFTYKPAEDDSAAAASSPSAQDRKSSGAASTSSRAHSDGDDTLSNLSDDPLLSVGPLTLAMDTIPTNRPKTNPPLPAAEPAFAAHLPDSVDDDDDDMRLSSSVGPSAAAAMLSGPQYRAHTTLASPAWAPAAGSAADAEHPDRAVDYGVGSWMSDDEDIDL